MEAATAVVFESKGHKSGNPAVNYADEHSLRFHPCQAKLREETLKEKMSIMLASASEMQLLQNIVRLINGKKTIDIGVYTGYSALSIALILPKDGKVIACDVTDEYLACGFNAWKEAGVDHIIEFVKAPAIDTLNKLITDGQSGTFDFAFIDADKGNMDNYYELCMKLIRPGGVIALDNTLLFGSVYDPSVESPNVEVVKALNKKLAKDERVHISFIPMADGVTLLFKK